MDRSNALKVSFSTDIIIIGFSIIGLITSVLRPSNSFLFKLGDIVSNVIICSIPIILLLILHDLPVALYHATWLKYRNRYGGLTSTTDYGEIFKSRILVSDIIESAQYSSASDPNGSMRMTPSLYQAILLGLAMISLLGSVTIAVSAQEMSCDGLTCAVNSGMPFSIDGETLVVLPYAEWFVSTKANALDSIFTIRDHSSLTLVERCGNIAMLDQPPCLSCFRAPTVPIGATITATTQPMSCSGTGNGFNANWGPAAFSGKFMPAALLSTASTVGEDALEAENPAWGILAGAFGGLSGGYSHSYVTVQCPGTPVSVAASELFLDTQIDLSTFESAYLGTDMTVQASYKICRVLNEAVLDCEWMSEADDGSMVIYYGDGSFKTYPFDGCSRIVAPMYVPAVTQGNGIRITPGTHSNPTVMEPYSSCPYVVVPLSGVSTLHASIPAYNQSMGGKFFNGNFDSQALLGSESICALTAQGKVNPPGSMKPVSTTFVNHKDGSRTQPFDLSCYPNAASTPTGLNAAECTAYGNDGMLCPVLSMERLTVDLNYLPSAYNDTTVNFTHSLVLGNNTKCYYFTNGLASCIMPASADNHSVEVATRSMSAGRFTVNTLRSDICDFTMSQLSNKVYTVFIQSGNCSMFGVFAPNEKPFAGLEYNVTISTTGAFEILTNYGFLTVYSNFTSAVRRDHFSINTTLTIAVQSGAYFRCPGAKSVCGGEPLCESAYGDENYLAESIIRLQDDCMIYGSAVLGTILYIITYGFLAVGVLSLAKLIKTKTQAQKEIV